MKKARQGWLWLAGLIVIFAVVSYFAYSPKLKYYPSFVSDSPSPTGVKGFYTYLQQEMNVKRWSHMPDLLPKDEMNQLLVMVEPSMIPETEEMNAYEEFIKAGNTVLLLKHNPKGLFGIKTEPVEEPEKADSFSKIRNQNHKTNKATIQSTYRLELENKDDRLLSDESGVIAMKRLIGNGKLIVLVTPEWLTNESILTADHLPLILSIINESDASSILFDEYLHAAGETPSALTVYPKWFLLLIFQGIVIALLGLWLLGKRFGPIFLPREASIRFSDEGIRAMAAWYLRGRRYHDSLIIQADYVKLLLQEHWQIPYTREWQEIHSFLERKWIGMKPADIHSFVQGLGTILDKETIHKQEYLTWSKKLDRLQKEVEQS